MLTLIFVALGWSLPLFTMKSLIFYYYSFVITDILKHFNQNLTGYSVGTGKEETPQSFLNQAVAGAKSR